MQRFWGKIRSSENLIREIEKGRKITKIMKMRYKVKVIRIREKWLK